MTRREELAEKILLALLANSGMLRRDTASPTRDREVLRTIAWDEADAFLAECEPEPETVPTVKMEREPDAVWVLWTMRGADGLSVVLDGDEYQNRLRLLAGRDRVRLRVFVEEVEA